MNKRQYAFLLVLPAILSGQSLTTVANTINGPDNLPATGTAYIRLTAPCTFAGTYIQTRLITQPFTAGAFSVALVPNDTCQTADGGYHSSYKVNFTLAAAGSPTPTLQMPQQSWYVPTAFGVRTISSVIVNPAPIPGVPQIQLAQLAQDGATTGQSVCWNGTGWAAGSCASMTLTTTGSSGPATLSSSVLNIPQYAAGGGALTYSRFVNSTSCALFPDQVIYNTDISQVPVSVLDTITMIGSNHTVSNMSCSAGVMTVTLSDGTGGWAPGMQIFLNSASPSDFNAIIGKAGSSLIGPAPVTLTTVTSNQITYPFTCPIDTYIGSGYASTGPVGSFKAGETPEFVVNFHTNTTPSYQVAQGALVNNQIVAGASFSNFSATNSDNVTYPICAFVGTGCATVDVLDGGAPLNTAAGGYCGNNDAHLLEVNTDTCQLYELYCMYGTGPGGQNNLTGPPFYAAAGAWWDLKTANMRTFFHTNPTNQFGINTPGAGGNPISPLVATGADILAGTPSAPIKHAVRFSLPNSATGYVWPSTGYASKWNNAYLMPMGTLLRLRSDVDQTTCHKDSNIGLTYPLYMQGFLNTLQHYGMYLDDNGLFLIDVGSDMTSDQNADFSGWMHCITGADFEVVNTNVLQSSSTSYLVRAFTTAADALPIQAAVISSPAGLTLTTDSSTCIAPCSLAWSAGTSHTLSGAAQGLYGAPVWSDSGANPHTVTPTAAVTYTATFTQIIAGTPTFAVPSGNIISGVSDTLASVPSGCTAFIYWSPTNNPPTTSDTHSSSITVTASGTYYAKVIGCPSLADSAVGSATYTVVTTGLYSHILTASTAATVTTPALNAAGAHLIVLSVNAPFGAINTPTSSPSNTWTQVSGGNLQNTMWYCINPTTTGSMTFSVVNSGSGGGFQLGLTAMSFADVITAFDGAGAGGSLLPGSITPTASGDIFVTTIGGYTFKTSTPAINSSFTIADSTIATIPLVTAWLLESGSAAVSPTWSGIIDGGYGSRAVMAAFKH